jgi:hypothetical protein
MTNRRRSATTRSVRAQSPEQLLELTQESPPADRDDRRAQRSRRGRRAEGDQTTTHAAGLQGAAAPARGK